MFFCSQSSKKKKIMEIMHALRKKKNQDSSAGTTLSHFLQRSFGWASKVMCHFSFPLGGPVLTPTLNSANVMMSYTQNKWVE